MREKEGEYSCSYRPRAYFAFSFLSLSLSFVSRFVSSGLRSSFALSQVSGNQESRHSLSGAGTRDPPPVKSREVAIKLTSKKKRDRVVNFLSSRLALSRSRFCLRHPFTGEGREEGVQGAYCKLTRILVTRTLLSFSRRKRHYTLDFTGCRATRSLGIERRYATSRLILNILGFFSLLTQKCFYVYIHIYYI